MNVCQVLISNGWGGAEARIYNLVRSLRDKGEIVSFITNEEMLKYYSDLEHVSLCNIGPLFPPESFLPRIAANSIKVDILRQALVLAYDYFDELTRYQKYKSLRKVVLEFLSVNQVQIIHSHLPLSSILISNLGRLKIPVITSERGDHELRGLVPTHPLMSPLVNWRAKKFSKALSEADRVTVVSNFMLQALKDWGIPLVSKPVVIHDGINIAEIQKSNKSTLKLKGNFNLLFPGGAKWTKGGDLLVAALPKVKEKASDIHLYIALHVPKDHLIRKLVTKLGLELNVTFTDFLSVPEYRSLLNSVDVFVLPSRIEAFSLAILEAMALGKPIIAANRGGTPEAVFNSRNGILVGLDSDEIAQAILHLYENKTLCREMSENNLKDIIKFDSSSVVDQYIGLYRDMLASTKS